jgi:type IV pilus assembly protein PilB
MAVVKKDLGQILLERGVINQEQLSQALDVQRSAPGDIGRIIVDLGFVEGKEKDVLKARAEVLGCPYVDLTTTKVEQGAVNLVPEHLAKKYTIIPFKKDGMNLTVATADPTNPYMTGDLRVVTGCQIKMALASEDDILDAIRRSYKAGDDQAPASPLAPTAGEGGGAAPGALAASLKEAIASYGSKEISADEDDTGALQEAAQEAPIIRIVNAVITQAIREGATDIHVEPDRRGLRIRYRIDGVLHETMSVPKYIQAPLVSRLKIMSEMDIAERRIPQDGRIGVRTGDGKDFDLRVSSLPTIHGEKIVMRILDKTSVLLGLNKLGFTSEVQAQIEELTNQPNGMVLSTGPTGSGKTTTQYSVLHRLNSIERNIITIEDPVEYQLSGIAQVAVNKKAGLTFGNALRAFLRQDPDIIMVGEMRDLETAEIAIEASLTGHLVSFNSAHKRLSLCCYSYGRYGRRALSDLCDGYRRYGPEAG